MLGHIAKAWRKGRAEPWEPQCNVAISFGREMEMRSLTPSTRKMAARKANGGDCTSKDLSNGCDSVSFRLLNYVC